MGENIRGNCLLKTQNHANLKKQVYGSIGD